MKKRRQGEMDKTIFLLVTIIVMIGVIMVYSSSYIQAYYSNRKMYHFFLSFPNFHTHSIVQIHLFLVQY